MFTTTVDMYNLHLYDTIFDFFFYIFKIKMYITFNGFIYRTAWEMTGLHTLPTELLGHPRLVWYLSYNIKLKVSKNYADLKNQI